MRALTEEQRELATQYYSVSKGMADHFASVYPGAAADIESGAHEGLMIAAATYKEHPAGFISWVRRCVRWRILRELSRREHSLCADPELLSSVADPRDHFRQIEIRDEISGMCSRLSSAARETVECVLGDELLVGARGTVVQARQRYRRIHQAVTELRGLVACQTSKGKPQRIMP